MEVLEPGSTSVLTSTQHSVGNSIYDFGFMESPEWNWFNNYWYYGNTFPGTQSMFYYEVSMQYLSMLKTMFTAKIEYLYRRRQRKLWLYSHKLVEGELICLYGTKILDPEKDDCIWDSDWLKAYATALVGLQWATNLSKFR